MSTDAEMLLSLSQLDSVEALSVSNAEHVAQSVPEWCELVLRLDREGKVRRLHLTRHDAEAIIEVLHVVLHPNTHKTSPVQKLWVLLDETMDYLLADDDPEPEDKARAKALAEAIVLVSQPTTDPEHIDVDGVRDEAVERWENRD